jgi:large subunit ribosomal protein L24
MTTSKRFAPKLSIKKGDKVQVIAGSNKGESGEVKQVFPKENRAIVDGLNLVKETYKGYSG